MPDRQGAVKGITVYEDGGVMIEGPTAIDYYRLCVLHSSLKLQKLGIKTHRGPAATTIARRDGFRGNIDKIIAQVKAEIERRREEGV